MGLPRPPIRHEIRGCKGGNNGPHSTWGWPGGLRTGKDRVGGLIWRLGLLVGPVGARRGCGVGLSVAPRAGAEISGAAPFDKNGCSFTGAWRPSSWAKKIAKEQSSSRPSD